LPRHIGRLEAQVDQLENRQSRFEVRMDTDIKALHDKIAAGLDGIHQRLDALTESTFMGRGAWKGITIAASALAFALTIAMWGVSEYLGYQEAEISIYHSQPPFSAEDLPVED